MIEKRYNQIYILSVLTAIIILGFSSCKNYDFDEEIRKTDNLINKIIEAGNTQVIDQNKLRNRIDSMEQRISMLKQLDSGRMSKELQLDILKYNSIVNNYKEFLVDYNIVEYKNDVYRQELKNIKEETINHKFTKEEFVELFQEKEKIVNEHLMKTKELVRSITEVEKVYQRINYKIIQFFEKEEKSKN
jgi:hypothetical protein